MSSTNRGAIKSEFDYYITNPDDIVTFLMAIDKNDKQFAKWMRTPGVRILDPCAGGNKEPVDWLFKEGKPCKECGIIGENDACHRHKFTAEDIIHIEPTEMSYPKAIRQVYGPGPIIETIDIREDSPADMHGNFLEYTPAPNERPDIIITNPPFGIALDIIKHSLEIVKVGGFVIMLQRLNFFGSKTRKPFWDKTMSFAHYIHHERMGFIPSRPGATDSIEYAHYAWSQGWYPGYSIGRVI
jgi:hypothetical protein